MSCVLRASGESFDVEQFLLTCTVEPLKIWRKGELRFPKSRPNFPANRDSGVNFKVSAADFSEFQNQLNDARTFLSSHAELLQALANFPGVEAIVMDFGTEIHPPGWCWFSIPPDILALLGASGVTLMLSVYPVFDECEE